MKTERWEAELEIMQRHFPQFTPFYTKSSFVGFAGYLRGPRTDTLYEIVIKAREGDYPSKEPATYIEPRPEREHWIHDDVGGSSTGKLCYVRNRNAWLPARSTFANCLMVAVKYLAEFDR